MNQTLTQACIPYGLRSKFPENNFLMMIESGAKGSGINMAQMAAQVRRMKTRRPTNSGIFSAALQFR